MLSGDKDLTLHRAPRCAGLRYVHHRWELFSRDTTYRVYLAPDAGGRVGGRGPDRNFRGNRVSQPGAPGRYHDRKVSGPTLRQDNDCAAA